jgi:ABC-type phosphate transport system auxiliary subunit
MEGRQASYIVSIGFLLLATWEGAKHFWFKGLPAAEQQLMSVSMELGLALIITVVALRVVGRRARREMDRRARYETVVLGLTQ